MSKMKINFIVVLMVLILHLSSLIHSAALQGKLEKFGSLGILSAQFVPVTLNPSGDDTIIRTINTDSDGMFYFDECQPGIYILKVWCRGIDAKPLEFEVTVKDQPVTNINPISIHSLKFKYPKEGQTFPQQVEIKAKGIHYNIPEDDFIWLILKNRNGNYYLPTKYAVKLNTDATWESKPLEIFEGSEEILAVLVTKECNNKFRLLSGSPALNCFAYLPKACYLIAQRKISGPPSSLPVVEQEHPEKNEKNNMDKETSQNRERIN